MKAFNIQSVSKDILADLKHKIDNKTKPIGALGQLEEIAAQIGSIQNSLNPKLSKPAIVVFAGDHGIAADGAVNLYPQEVTWQMVYNFLAGGAAINVFANQNEIDIKVVDAGVNHDFEPNPKLIDAKVAKGTKNYLHEPAMTEEQSIEAIEKGAEIVKNIEQQGCNIIGFGEMGIGNTSAASLLMSALTKVPIEQCVGSGTGLDGQGVERKKQVLSEVMQKHNENSSVLNVLSYYGGFEIAMICGGILQATELGMVIMIDGFIVTSALLVASKLHPEVLDYCLFAHTSEEKGHQKLLDYLDAKPILNLNMRLGEGTGAAVAYPIIKSAVNFLNKMASFESAEVSNKD